jgi:aconitate decarboxylase
MPGDSQPELLVKNFSAPLRMVDPGVGFKKHPSNYFTHRPIDAALELREEFKIKREQIERVQVIFPRFDYVDRPQPRTGLDGKFSVQYATLIALIDGEITVDSFTNERRFADDVVSLLPKVEFKADDSIPADFDTMYTIVNVWLKDGRELSKKVDKLSGWVGFPLTREQRLRKFFACSKRVIEEGKAQRMLGLVEKLETLPDIIEIMDIARCDGADR